MRIAEKAKHDAAAQQAQPFAVRQQGTPFKSFSDEFAETAAAKLKAKGAALKVPKKATTNVYSPDKTWSLATQESFDEFTVIDNNEDGRTWTYNSYLAAARSFYHSSNNSDDWLITPGVKLEGGKKYIYSFEAYAYGPAIGYDNEVEKFEVAYGTAPTVDGMSNTLQAETEMTNGEYELFEYEFTAPETGTYYFGLHAVSDPFMWYIYAKNVSVQVTPDGRAPGEVTDVVITPDADGKTLASIEFNAPTVDRDGNELTAISGVRINRDGEELADIKRVTIGGKLTFTDNYLEDTTEYVYSFIAYNEFGNGKAVNAKKYIGLDYPTPVLNPELIDNDGKGFSMKWEASTAAHEGVIKEIEYLPCTVTSQQSWFGTIYTPQTPLASLIDKTEWTDYANVFPLDEGEVGALGLGVFAQNDAGGAWDYYDCLSNTLYLGAPYVTPFKESFPGGAQENEVWLNGGYLTDNGYYATYYGGSKASNIYIGAETADNDGGSIEFVVNYADVDNNDVDSLYLKTWKLSLAGTTNPQLVFKRKFVSEIDSPAAEMFFFAENAKGEITQLGSKELTANDEDWVKEKIDLSQFIDEPRYTHICFGFKATTPADVLGTQHLFVDNIHIGDFPAVDASVDVKVPNSVQRGQSGTATVIVSNNGDQDLESYKVKLTVGEEEIVNYTVAQKLESLSAKTFTYNFDTDALDQNETIAVKAEVIVADDENEEDNAIEAEVGLTSPNLATVSDLKAEKTEDGDTPNVKLTWTAPNTDVQSIVESFEDYESFSVGGITADNHTGTLGRWTLYDEDGARTYYSGEDTYANKGAEMAWQVFDVSNLSNYPSARTGNKYLIAWDSAPASQSDPTPDSQNWLISPELSGNAQNISFYYTQLSAVDPTDQYYYGLEGYELYVSTTDTDIASFTKIAEGQASTAPTSPDDTEAWVEATAALDEGVKYFAIRHVANDVLGLMIDDVTFEAAAAGGEVELYRVYRDGQLIAETTSTDFTDFEVEDGDHTYQVVAVYSDGQESAAQAVDVVFTGIEAVVAAGEKFDVYTLSGIKVRENVTSAAGLNKGVYIINNKKVVIK